MENFFAIFPRYGKTGPFFHAMDRYFHTMEKLSSPGFRLSLLVVVCLMVLLPQGSPFDPPGGGKNFQAACRWISAGVRYFNA